MMLNSLQQSMIRKTVCLAESVKQIEDFTALRRVDAIRSGKGQDRIAAGASFESLARQFSQDPGSAGGGGDLGYFQRGQMVAPFEEAAFALEPGQLSDVVQTPMGFHLIEVVDRRVPGFDDVAVAFRRQEQARMIQEAESTYVASLVDQAAPVVVDGAYDIVRDVARTPGARLAGRGGRRRRTAGEQEKHQQNPGCIFHKGHYFTFNV